MSEQTQWPRGPWFARLAILASLASLCGLVKHQRDRMPLVEREDLVAFIRVTLPAVPGWKTYTVIETPKGELAVPSDTGTLYRVGIHPDREKLKTFLESDVYGKTLWRVLQWPLLAFLVIFVGFVRLGRMLDARRNGDRWIRGPKLVNRWHWNLRTAFQGRRSFYVEVE